MHRPIVIRFVILTCGLGYRAESPLRLVISCQPTHGINGINGINGFNSINDINS